jgi:hypothetical protein
MVTQRGEFLHNSWIFFVVREVYQNAQKKIVLKNINDVFCQNI